MLIKEGRNEEAQESNQLLLRVATRWADLYYFYYFSQYFRSLIKTRDLVLVTRKE